MSENKITLKTYGASHSERIGMELTGIKAGERFDLDRLQSYVDRRKAKNTDYSTKRLEPDKLIFKQGLEGGIATGETIIIEVENLCQKSSDYDNLKFIPRPSHADYPAFIKYKGTQDMRGGGVFSGRMTLPLVIAGGLAEQLLLQKGILVGAYISEIGGIRCGSYQKEDISASKLLELKNDDFPLLDTRFKTMIINLVERISKSSDSVGGIIECIALNVPTGTGEPMFESLESSISQTLFGIPAIKGVEFGLGFKFSQSFGSRVNDPYYVKDGKILTRTNNNGGILGGLATGMPITLRVAVKPTPSIGMEQNSVALNEMTPTTLKITGRHDSCIVPRAVVCVEAAVTLTLLKYLYN